MLKELIVAQFDFLLWQLREGKKENCQNPNQVTGLRNKVWTQELRNWVRPCHEEAEFEETSPSQNNILYTLVWNATYIEVTHWFWYKSMLF